MFEYSPYQTNTNSDYRNLHAKNLKKINQLVVDQETLKFAVLADNHYHYDNLAKVVADINTKADVAFVLCAGDIADQALQGEFEMFADVMTQLEKPYLTVIGNHDYNSNGETIYKDIFGDYNYSFNFNQYRFVFFDDVFWESNQEPKFDWLRQTLANNQDYKQTVLISHLPPFSDQLQGDLEKTFSSIIKDNGIKLSLHGHTHGYYYKETYKDGVKYLVTPWLKQAGYTIVTLDGASHQVEFVEL
jgi:3',5'-cyclic AMP phosphodiesterase CpdA